MQTDGGYQWNCALKVMVDLMYGAGAGYMEHILCNLGHNVLTIHSEQPFCGQLSPEPKEENLGNLAAAVRESRADLGIALDGDGDRFGFIGPDGNYISPNQVLPFMPIIWQITVQNILLLLGQWQLPI
jgi:phosphomannomutase